MHLEFVICQEEKTIFFLYIRIQYILYIEAKVEQKRHLRSNVVNERIWNAISITTGYICCISCCCACCFVVVVFLLFGPFLTLRYTYYGLHFVSLLFSMYAQQADRAKDMSFC